MLFGIARRPCILYDRGRLDQEEAMRIALIPLQVTSGDSRATLRAMARSVEAFHSAADLIVFPQIEIPGPGPGATAGKPRLDPVSQLHMQVDVTAAFAKKRSVYIAAGFWETRESDHYTMLALADRTGQVDIRTRKLSAEPATVNLGLSLVTARIATLHAGICLSDDLFEQALIGTTTSLGLRLLAVPIYLTASQEGEAGLENEPSPLAELRHQLGEVARKTRAHVMAVNSLSGEPGAAPCGGAWVYGPSGQVMDERALYDDTPLEFEIG
jgi:predicted amidohydrolase